MYDENASNKSEFFFCTYNTVFGQSEYNGILDQSTNATIARNIQFLNSKHKLRTLYNLYTHRVRPLIIGT